MKWRLFILIASAVLFLLSLAGVVVANTALPTEVEQEKALLNYEHKGRFDYLVSLKPSYLFGPPPEEPPPPPANPKYPAQIVDRINMTFSYQAARETSPPVEVNAVLENPGIWQKEISLVPKTAKTGDFTVDFTLDIAEINELFDTIDEEIKIASSSRNVTIIADVGSGSEVFSLTMKLENNLVEVGSNLSQTQSDSTGEFDYLIRLKENSLFDKKMLQPSLVRPNTSLPAPRKTIRPGEVIFSNLVDSMDATFYYDFRSDQPVTGLTEEVTVTAILENPEVWSKTFVLVPRTNKGGGSFSIGFPVNINYLMEMFETIRKETGVGAESYSLTIKADVHTVAETDYGPVDEVFSQTLSSELGKGTLEWKEELVESKPGSITVSQMIPNPNRYLGLSVSGVRILSSTAAGILFLLFLLSVVLYVRVEPVERLQIEREVLQVRKKYGKRIVETISQTSIESEKRISLGSIEDLIKVADELLKPIVHQAPSNPQEPHAYYVFDGVTLYEYLHAMYTKEQGSDVGKTE